MFNRVRFLSVALLLGTACSSASVTELDAGQPGPDAGLVDAGTSDAGPTDAGSMTDAGHSDAGALDSGFTAPSCWGWVEPSPAQLRASPKKVFSHYFPTFPLSIDNKPPAVDYYATQYLNPAGESSKHAYCGGYLRERPISPDPADAGVDFGLRNMRIEVARAVAIGLDGFAYDLLDPMPGSTYRTRLDELLQASRDSNTGFKILLIFDMSGASFGGSGGTDATALDAILTVLRGIGNDPALMRSADGGLVVAAYDAESRSAAFWNSALTYAQSDAGQHVQLMPMPIGGWAGGNQAHFAGVPLYGASSWGGGTVGAAVGTTSGVAVTRDAGIVYMAAVRPQDSRPKDLIYTESNNSSAYRAQWEAAIASDAPWVQLITWNDYSEDSEVAPSSVTQTANYDLAGYYTAWFKLGAPPTIARDALYYFHRVQNMDAGIAPPSNLQTNPYVSVNGATESDEIELVGLLSAPGTLQIQVGAHTWQLDAGIGLSALKAPLETGTPVFKLLRNGQLVKQLDSTTTITNTITYQDPLYHAGASLTCPVPLTP